MGTTERRLIPRVPTFIDRSDELTDPMHMIDHTCARLDGPPAIPDEDTVIIDEPLTSNPRKPTEKT